MIAKFFIERPVLANVIAVLMIVIGAAALFQLPVAQYPNGRTVHGVLVRPPGSRDWRRLGEFAGSTFDGQVLSFAPDEPMMDVGAIRIETSASPSWVAWREITILGRQP